MAANRRFDSVLFDLDGTLLDTLDDLADCMNRVLLRLGHPTHPTDRYRFMVGDGMDILAGRVLPEGCRTPEHIKTCVAGMRDEYGAHWADKTRPYRGIAELLDGLTERRIPFSILSNKPHDFTQLVVERLLGAWKFAVVQGVVPGGPKKPDPAGAVAVSRQLGIPCERFLYLGDTNTDMKTAMGARMFPVGALWGFRPREELVSNGARELVAQPEDVLRLIE